jgi:hypothetical protein
MHRAYLALIALAGVLALTFTGCALDANGIPQFSFDCPSFDNLKVTADPSGLTRYYYNGFCSLNDGPRDFYTVEGTYMPTHNGNPGSAFERITDTTMGPNSFVSFWLKCSGVDPWYTGTACAVTHHAGAWAQGIIDLKPVFPISSSVLTPAQRQQLKDAKNVWLTQPCPAHDMWLVIPTPGGNATYLNDIPLQVDPGPEWCQLPHVVNLLWQRAANPGSPNPNWTTIPQSLSPLQQLDIFQNPGGVTINKQLFDQIGTGSWRVTAQVAGQSGAPGSPWAYFKVK